MQRTTLAVMRAGMVAIALSFVLIATPACAMFESDSSAPPPPPPQISSDSSAPVLQPPQTTYQASMPQSLQPSAPAMENTNVLSESSAPPPANVSLNPNDGAEALASIGPSSGTVVGNRAQELRDEVVRLRSSVNLNAHEFEVQRTSGTAGSVQYHSTVAAITARLQNGTTKGNPILLRQWDEANSALNEVSSSMGRLNSLQTSVEADASLAAYLLGSIQAAFDLSGAVDEDHDQLKILRDETSRISVKLDYLRTQIADDIQRQTAYLNSERANMQTLAFAISRGELIGGNISSHPTYSQSNSIINNSNAPMSVPSAAPVISVQPGVTGPAPMSPRDLMKESDMISPNPAMAQAPEEGLSPNIGQLLVLIRYNRPTVNYEAQLSQAVGAALERRPNAQFSVVAVSPSSGAPSDVAREKERAARDAAAVKRSLVQLGLAPSRISSASTQTQNANTPEVHVYIR